MITKKHEDIKALSIIPNLFLISDEDSKNQQEYLLIEIDRLHDSLNKYKNILNELADKKDMIKYLEEFRNKFSFKCIIDYSDNKYVTILQCADRIKRGKCKFYKDCIPRKNLLNEMCAVNIG